MDETTKKVVDLYRKIGTINGVAREMDCGLYFVRKRLIDCGEIKTKESELYAQGFTVDEIVKKTGRSRASVSRSLPYLDGAKKEVKKVAGDRTADYVLILYGQGESIKAIAKRLEMCEQKVRRILITENQFYTEEAKLFADGYSIEDICKRTGKKRSAVIGRIPYTKCLYNAETPSQNALAMRKHKEKKKNRSK